MRTAKLALLLAAMLACGIADLSQADAQDGPPPRQYYSSWKYNYDTGYWYRIYYYKPEPVYEGYHTHYCIYYHTRPQYVYYYNRYNRTYWGRYDLKGKKGEEYSLLENKDRKGKLDDIPEKAFPKPAKMPQVPEAKDDVLIDAPPKDLPPKVPPKKDDDLPK